VSLFLLKRNPSNVFFWVVVFQKFFQKNLKKSLYLKFLDGLAFTLLTFFFKNSVFYFLVTKNIQKNIQFINSHYQDKKLKNGELLKKIIKKYVSIMDLFFIKKFY
jgi:hypothetical protein